ncbi:NAD(P)(+) transhydrogenase (Re/Si-specific) subunit beta [Actinophytocola sp.]|uniref:NAD(P)(+) transhydrogenase (Re/Si-specific) subunit beta n=1 Tax=Actinophytocola sp. TaxID=1872138 RepID=UPI002DB9CFDA|nr:NAD(P)(+) transhydrogenase (Re/Si-specific) subunit beta [Actinophytocola sp.]
MEPGVGGTVIGAGNLAATMPAAASTAYARNIKATLDQLGLHEMNSPATARRGNLLSAAGMAAAVLATVVLLAAHGGVTTTGWIVLAGAVPGAVAALRVRMTAMPQLVSVFNAVGGGAAALLATVDLIEHRAAGGSGTTAVAGAADIVIGTVTFTGSLVAAGKLQGWVPGRPLLYPGARIVTALLAVLFIAGGVWLVADPASSAALALALGAAAAFTLAVVLPGHRDDQPQVGPDHVLLGPPAILDHGPQPQANGLSAGDFGLWSPRTVGRSWERGTVLPGGVR